MLHPHPVHDPLQVAAHLGQVLERHPDPLPERPGLGRVADQPRVGRGVGDDPALRRDLGPVPDLDVVRHPDLPGEDDVVAGRTRPGDADLGGEDVVPADLAVVPDHDEVVDLRPGPDPGRAERAPVDRAPGADLHVVLDLDPPQLRHLRVLTVLGPVAEPVRADDDTGVDRHPAPDQAVVVHDDPRVERRVGPDLAAAADDDAGVQDGAGADARPFADDRGGADAQSEATGKHSGERAGATNDFLCHQ